MIGDFFRPAQNARLSFSLLLKKQWKDWVAGARTRRRDRIREHGGNDWQ